MLMFALTKAQWIYSVGLAATALLITWFAIYVAWTTVWGNRWYRRQK
jgi:hypothetical protein